MKLSVSYMGNNLARKGRQPIDQPRAKASLLVSRSAHSPVPDDTQQSRHPRALHMHEQCYLIVIDIVGVSNAKLVELLPTVNQIGRVSAFTK